MDDGAIGLRWNVEQRLEFIEFRLLWDRMIRRKDLTEKFDVSVPQASADLATYQRQAPGNMEYDSSRKAYVPTSGFKPRFLADVAARDYLSQLRLIADGAVAQEETWLGWMPPYETVPLVRRRTSTAKLQRVLNGIRYGLALYVNYQSMNRPEPLWRWITPHALGFDGFRWHARAWCHRREAFRDFVLGRIVTVDREREDRLDPGYDHEWQNKVTLRIGPNPKLQPGAKEAIALEYGMKAGELSISSRVCLSYYVEKHLGLDLDQYGVPPERQQIVMLNRREVEEIRVAMRAPSATDRHSD